MHTNNHDKNEYIYKLFEASTHPHTRTYLLLLGVGLEGLRDAQLAVVEGLLELVSLLLTEFIVVEGQLLAVVALAHAGDGALLGVHVHDFVLLLGGVHAGPLGSSSHVELEALASEHVIGREQLLGGSVLARLGGSLLRDLARASLNQDHISGLIDTQHEGIKQA
jgi:hypothetical protein